MPRKRSPVLHLLTRVLGAGLLQYLSSAVSRRLRSPSWLWRPADFEQTSLGVVRSEVGSRNHVPGRVNSLRSGEGATAYLSPLTMRLVAAWLQGSQLKVRATVCAGGGQFVNSVFHAPE